MDRLLKAARASGSLNLSNRSLRQVLSQHFISLLISYTVALVRNVIGQAPTFTLVFLTLYYWAKSRFPLLNNYFLFLFELFCNLNRFSPSWSFTR